MNPIRIIIIEDHTVLRQTLAACVAMQEGLMVAGQFGTAASALEFLASTPADLALIDYELPDMDGITFLKQALERAPGLHGIFLSMHVVPAIVEEAFREGAMAYLPKTVELDELIRAISLVSAGEQYLHHSLSTALVRKYAPRRVQEPAMVTLTEEQALLLKLTGEGNDAKEIALHLGIPVSQVKHRFSDIYRVLGVRNKSQALYRALELGLIRLKR